ncbi:hypothetical protein H5410_003966 [Solanum commersonii]|uniref:Uncharacterized protein n=1 Tax=Solanum commersonii TaxID=4109 RepID=A0A9J6B6F1_SOLCO|nr:hypothetical protein H5410_003966 [Solanum commersonii]
MVRLDPCLEQQHPNPHASLVVDQAQSRLVERRYPTLSRPTPSSLCRAIAWSASGGSNSIDVVGMGPSYAPIYPKQMLPTNDTRARLGPEQARLAHTARGVIKECYLVDPANSHMIVSKKKPCMCNLFDGIYYSDNSSNSRANMCNKPRLLEGMHLLDKRSMRALPVAAMINDYSMDCTTIVPDFGPITLAFWIGVMINTDSQRHSYFIVRGEILGFMKDEQQRKHFPRMFSLIKNESWGLEDNHIPS